MAKISYEQANIDLLNIDWRSELTCLDVNAMWSSFVNRLRAVLLENTTYRTICTDPRKPWLCPGLIGLIRTKKALWQRYRRSGSTSDFLAHRQFSNSLSSMIFQAKKDFENHVARSSDRKLFYKSARSKLQSKVSIPILHDSTGSLCKSGKEVAEEFASNFTKAFIEEPPGRLPAISTSANPHSISTVVFDTEEIKQLLRTLATDTSPGPDQIDARVLKFCSDGLALPLSLIMTCSFRHHILPDDWLCGIVTPIYKKGDKLQAHNYRPITLTSLVCKIAEKIIQAKMFEFAVKYSILPPQQHGFIPGRSVITNLLTCVNDWTISINQGSPVDIIYLDFAKAFDRVPRKRLLKKLHNHGIRGDLLSWIEAYLSHRSFQVRVGGDLSAPHPVVSGVPQGSTLGPLLFLLYTADLPSIIKSRSAFFADDTKIYGNPLEDGDKLQEDIDAVERWCRDWLLPVNPDKCSVMYMGRNNPKTLYKIDGKQIKEVTTQVDLGIMISSDLSWTPHIEFIVAKANRMLYLIRRGFPGCSLENLGQFYRTYIRPIIEYAGPVWHPVLQRDSELLENVQRRATRLTLGVSRPSYEERLQVCKLSSYLERKLRGDLIFTYRALHGLLGVDMAYLYQLNTNNLRGHNFKLRKEKFTTTVRQHFLSNRIFDCWNALPHQIVNAASVNRFKNCYDRHMS